MFGIEVIILMIFIRVILPVLLLLVIGDWVQQRETHVRFG